MAGTAPARESQTIAADGRTDEQACLNCGTALVGPHCHRCGQAAHVHRTLWALGHDLLHGLFHFEGKAWRTIGLLAWQPGRLTREYIDGRRASHVSPVFLFLFAVFMTFAAYHLIGNPVRVTDVPAAEAGKATRAQLEQTLATLRRERAVARAAHRDDDALEAIDDRIDAAEEALQAVPTETGPAPKPRARIQSDLVAPATTARIEHAWQHARANPELTALRLEQDAHKYSWLLIPLSIPFVWLLFPFNRRFRLYDHAVFVAYSLSFMLLLQAAMVAAGVAGLSWLVVLLMPLVPLHMFRQLRGTYALGRRGAAWRTAALLLASTVVIVVWMLALLGLLLAE